MSDIKEYYDKKINECITKAVKSSSDNIPPLYDEFYDCVEPTLNEIITATKQKILTSYNFNQEVMRLVESNVILDLKINKKRKYIIMEAFNSFNVERQKILKKKVEDKKTQIERAKQTPELADFAVFYSRQLEDLSKELEKQNLYNYEYENHLRQK